MPETSVSIPARGTVLEGSYRTPADDGPHPAALLIAGSGPLDRNGDLGRLRFGVSERLATILAEHGWASLRFDKRGVVASTGGYLTTGFHEEFDDAVSALHWLASRNDVSHVVPIGHSAGALHAARMAAQRAEVAGAVLLAPTAATGEETLMRQARCIAERQPAWRRVCSRLLRAGPERRQRQTLDTLRASTSDVVRLRGQPINARWMREFMAHDPVADYEAARVPMLAITGSKDVQVDPGGLEVIADVATGRASTLVAADVDHILRVERSPTSDPSRYHRQVAAPLARDVTDAVVEWLDALMAARDAREGAGQGSTVRMPES